MRRKLASVVVVLSIGMVGCGEMPEDAVETAAPLSLPSMSVLSRPIGEASIAFGPCCNATIKVVPSGSSAWEAVDEATCDDSTSYVVANAPSQYPYYAGMAFDMNLAGFPIGKSISGITAFVCARPAFAYFSGNFKGEVAYWGSEVGYRWLSTADGDETVPVPGVGLFQSNPFKLMAIQTSIAASAPPSRGGKTASSRMTFVLSGDNVQISQVFLKLDYTYTFHLPF